MNLGSLNSTMIYFFFPFHGQHKVNHWQRDTKQQRKKGNLKIKILLND